LKRTLNKELGLNYISVSRERSMGADLFVPLGTAVILFWREIKQRIKLAYSTGESTVLERPT
jgi:hypothetical protein